MEGKPVTAADVARIIRLWLARGRGKSLRQVQVAFYGGSFTGLSVGRQEELLTAVAPFIQRGEVQAVRLSTRPDYIDSDTVGFLRGYHVATVELGVQSLDDRVLKLSLRGHRAEDAVRASGRLQSAGMELGIQLMVGLQGQNFTSLRKTTNQVMTLAPDFVRIYPVLVVEGSGLEQQFRQRAYRPLSLSLAVLQTAWMKKKFTAAGIRVVRMGLQPGPELERSLVTGPYHPAFGELVNGRLMLQQTRRLLCRIRPGQRVNISISDRDQSVFRGIRSVNIHRLTSLGLSDRFILQTDTRQPRGTVKLVSNP